MAMVEVVTSDGHMELWAAALPLSGAVAAIQDVIPADCIATLSDRRLLITHPYGVSVRRSSKGRAAPYALSRCCDWDRRLARSFFLKPAHVQA